MNSDIKITSMDRLNQYIKYCIDNNQNKKILNEDGYSETSYHHILPNALFQKYSVLKYNKWNGTHLEHFKHYYAHWILTEAIDDYGQLFAFCSMHKTDVKLGRINESDLIPENEFQEKMEERTKKYLIWYKENEKMMREKQLIWKSNNTEIIEQGRLKHIETINSIDWLENIGNNMRQKQKETKSSKEWQENVWKPAMEKRLKLIGSKEWKESVGKEAIKKYKLWTENNPDLIIERSKKCAKTKLSKEWKESVGIKFKINTRKTKILSSKEKYGVFDVYKDDTLIFSNMSKSELRKISGPLYKATKEKPMGHSKSSRTKLTQLGKEEYIGYYVINKLYKNRNTIK
jgi:hypothetical protein